MNLENVEYKIWESVDISVFVPASKSMWKSVYASVWDSVWDSVQDSVGKSVDGLHGSIIKEREQE
jgi:hypothetical protein